MAEISDFERRINEECEAVGEVAVRKRLRQGIYSGKNKNYVEAWLERLAVERAQEEREASISNANTQTELARAAADAARDAADAARDQSESAREANDLARQANDIAQKANIIATIALVAAAIAIAISIVGIFISQP